jgi:cobalt-zinc-cadmium resistance protein CzcA
LFSLKGIEGKMFAPLVASLLIALLVSLVVALTIIPVLAKNVLKQTMPKEFGFVRRFHQSYLRLLPRVINRPKLTLGMTMVVLLASLALVPFLGTEFIPPLDEGAIAINIVRLPNASLEGSVKVSSYIEKRLMQFPEIDTVVSKNGRAEISEDPMGPEETDVFIMLKPRQHWGTGRDKRTLVELIQKELASIPGIRCSFSQPIELRVNELVSGIKSDLAVKVFGSDLELLKRFADRAAVILQGVKGIWDVKVEQVSGMSQLDVVIDRQAAAHHGIKIIDVKDVIETAIAGKRATTLIEEQRRFAVVVRFIESARNDISALERLRVPTPSGAHVSLSQIAQFKTIEAPAQVSRENGMRRVVTEANIRGRDLGRVMTDVEMNLAPLMKELPSGYYFEYGGQFENQTRAMHRIAMVVPIALFLIVVLLTMALGSIRNALLVLLNLPLALVGGVLALVAFQLPVSVSAAVAGIVLLGIAVQNGVVLMTFFRQLQDRGESVTHAVINGCDQRFRPLFMTAMTSFIGHLPMLGATGLGADLQKPLAVVVMGGLVTSTLLTLFVLPTLYSLGGKGRDEGNGKRILGR